MRMNSPSRRPSTRCSACRLRHTMATCLREAGMDKRDISDLLAQKSNVMGLHYSRDASLARKNKLTMAVSEKENERWSKVVRP